jgi:peroxiredoxin
MTDSTNTGIPRIGDVAPDFEAITTQGPLKFSEWQNKNWVILFSHPADFTPVCSTELTEFSKRSGEFGARNAKLMGISIDSIHSHLAWRENLKQILDADIDYPLIADIDMQAAREHVHDGHRARRVRDRPQARGARARLLPDERRAQRGRGAATPDRAADRRPVRLRDAGELEAGRQGDRAAAQERGGGQGARVAQGVRALRLLPEQESPLGGIP